jgi:hypothetical protein
MRTAALKNLFDEAFAVAGGAPLEEQPAPGDPSTQTTSGNVPVHHDGCSARIAPDAPSDEAVIAVGTILLLIGVRLRRRQREDTANDLKP